MQSVSINIECDNDDAKFNFKTMRHCCLIVNYLCDMDGEKIDLESVVVCSSSIAN